MSGDIIFETSAIATHLARMSPSAGLMGANLFQEAQVNQWIAWADWLTGTLHEVESTIQGKDKKVNMDKYNANVKRVKEQIRDLNNHLNGKQWISGNKVSVADIVCGCLLTPAFQTILDAGFRKGHGHVAAWFERFAALPEVVKTAGNIKACAKALKPTTDFTPATAAKKAAGPKEAKKEDDDLDLFGDDNEEDAAAAKAAAEKVKAGAKKPKKVVIAQSLVLFEVKPLDNETDLDALAKRILAINQDGLYWKTEYKKEPVAFGIFKIIIGMTVEDEKVSVDDIVEKIEAFDDMCQSVEILAFNKI